MQRNAKDQNSIASIRYYEDEVGFFLFICLFRLQDKILISKNDQNKIWLLFQWVPAHLIACLRSIIDDRFSLAAVRLMILGRLVL